MNRSAPRLLPFFRLFRPYWLGVRDAFSGEQERLTASRFINLNAVALAHARSRGPLRSGWFVPSLFMAHRSLETPLDAYI